jgi:hypothetical protein
MLIVKPSGFVYRDAKPSVLFQLFKLTKLSIAGMILNSSSHSYLLFFPAGNVFSEKKSTIQKVFINSLYQ